MVDHPIDRGAEAFLGVVGTSLDLGLDHRDPVVGIGDARLETGISTCLSGEFHGVLGSSSEPIGLGFLWAGGRFADVRPLKASR